MKMINCYCQQQRIKSTTIIKLPIMTSILSESTNSDQQQQIAPMIAQAYTLLCDQRLQESIEVYKQCIQRYPKCWRAYQNLGVAYIMRKDFVNANHVLRTYVQHKPRDPLGHDSLGVSYSQLNDPLQAIASFVNSINISPNQYMSFYNLGVVLGKLQLYEFALSIYQRCLNLYPNYINAINNVADIYKKLGRIDQAIDIFKQVIQIDPGYVLGIKNLGNCYLTKKDHFSALVTYLQALKFDPTNQTVLHNLALCLDYYGLYDQAAIYVNRSYQHSQEPLSPSNIVKPFIAANLFSKALHQVYSILRMTTKLGIDGKDQLQAKFLEFFTASTNWYNAARKLLPQCQQIYLNLNFNRLNFIGYHAKLNRVDDLIFFTNKLQYFPESKMVIKHVRIQKMFTQQIIKWRQKTKRILRKESLQYPRKPPGFFQQQLQVTKIFSEKLIPLQQQLEYKSSTYISRMHHHNLKRLILKRVKFIKKYNKFNAKVQKLFKYHIPLASLTETNSNIQQDL